MNADEVADAFKAAYDAKKGGHEKSSLQWIYMETCVC